MKKIFILLSLFFLLFTSTSFPQWWVDGGNVIWPHGDVTLSKGSLHIKDSDTTTSSVWSDTEALLYAKGNRSSWWGVIQAEATGVDGDDPTIPLIGVTGIANSYYSSGELYNGTFAGYFINNPRLSGTATTKTNFNFPTNSATGIFGSIAVNSYTDVDLDIVCSVGSYLTGWQMENDITNYLGFASVGYVAESDSFSVQNYYAYYSRTALLLKDVTNYYGYYSDDVLAGTNVTNFYHFYGNGDYPSYFGGDISLLGEINTPDSSLLTITSGITKIALNDATDAINIIADNFQVNDGGLNGIFFDESLSKVALTSVGTALMGDWAAETNGTTITVDVPNDRITLDALKILLNGIPSDSTSVATGELWFNSSTGALHRKF